MLAVCFWLLLIFYCCIFVNCCCLVCQLLMFLLLPFCNFCSFIGGPFTEFAAFCWLKSPSADRMFWFFSNLWLLLMKCSALSAFFGWSWRNVLLFFPTSTLLSGYFDFFLAGKNEHFHVFGWNLVSNSNSTIFLKNTQSTKIYIIVIKVNFN